jgi:hypothetical protein
VPAHSSVVWITQPCYPSCNRVILSHNLVVLLQLCCPGVTTLLR